MLTAAVGSASEPDFRSGGFVLSLQYGPGFWNLSAAGLASQLPDNVDDANKFVADLRTSHVGTIQARYSILGHVSLGVDFTGTGWSPSPKILGGAGFLAGTVAWHPLELVFVLLKKTPRSVPVDLSTAFGVGYGIAGQRRGMDGLLYEWTLELDYFVTRYFALGAFVRGVFFSWNKLYLNYIDRSLPGNTLVLAQGSGGSFWTFGVSLSFRAGD